MSWEVVAAHAAGLVALTGGEAGPLVRVWRRGGDDAARAELRRLAGIFGADRVAVEVHRHQLRGEEERNAALVRLAREAGLAVVATQDALGASGADGPVLDLFTCLREHCTLDAAGRRLEANRARVLRSPAAMARLWADLPEAVANTVRVAARCAFRLRDLPYRFPRARLDDDRSEAEELFARVEAGARERYRTIAPRVRAQLDRELSLIVRLGLCGYFLVVHDIVRFCRARGILAQGRGSAANSAVCYALSITAVDPIAMELLFERFLSEERGEWPDIDIDLPSGDRREEVIQHVYRTYGERGAAMTANVITYRGRSAVREAGKVLGFSEEHLDRLSKLVGWGFGRDARGELTAYMRETGLAPEEGRGRMLVELVARLLHLPRHLGQHSGGMVLARGRLDDVVPLEPAAMPGRTVIQWDKDDCADLGIIKVDLLGLGMLCALEEVVPLVRRHEGVELDLAHLPPDDPATYDMICRADTVGVFQIESRAQMATLPRMRPRRFYDLVVEVAIIRPGPIVGKMVHPFLNRRMGREKVVYP
ncbi:MAG: error-prone DNA polymerase, partial [Thermoanaerobaculaceae bacterium]|nr:error-prone DNA polymerase [Thermoanaerobaculaceae bacterium]